MEIIIGWCCCWERCRAIGVACVRTPGVPELCIPCAAAELGITVEELEERRVAA